VNQPGDPPLYSVRESKKAKRVSLRIFPDLRFEVVIPEGFNRNRIPKIVSDKEEWIHKTLKKLDEKRECSSGDSLSARSLPERMLITATGDPVEVQYSKGMGSLELIERERSRLILTGDVDNHEACRHLLRAWLKHRAYVYLAPFLHKVSKFTGLSCRKVQIRAQKSRWGSCSSKGTISLNYKLLFLPHELVRYIMVHELCHTVHLDHSQQFWSLVARLEPDYKDLRARMKTADRLVPGWAR
jgi:predicted metal-dependent hydrolase